MGNDQAGSLETCVPPQAAPSVIVIDTVPIYRLGLLHLFGQAGYACQIPPESLQEWALEEIPDLIVMTIRSPIQSEVIQGIRASFESAPILALTEDESHREYSRLVRLGASVVLPLRTSAERLITSAAAAINGDSTLPSAMVLTLLKGNVATQEVNIEEVKLLRELAHGNTISATAKKLGYAERSLHRRLTKIYQKLAVKNRSEAIAEAARIGLLDAST